MEEREPVTGILLVGGASTRFGSPKALARVGGETLAERAWALLEACCDFQIAVGKRADRLPLPFEILDDGTDVRAPLAGLVAGLRASTTDLCVAIPVDCPALDAAAVRALAVACRGLAAVVASGPLPGAYRRAALPVLERRLGTGKLRLRDAARELAAATASVAADRLLNLNSPGDVAAAPHATAWVEIVRLPAGERRDRVAVEEPLEIQIGREPIAVTMRTPGSDEELALGFAIGEGLEPLAARAAEDLAANTVELVVARPDLDRLRRNFYTSSSCGVCGKGALAAVAVSAGPSHSNVRFAASTLAELPARLRRAQRGFDLTGGLHAAGLFDEQSTLLCVREDVGRHNAVDKVVGWAFREGQLPLERHALCVSGRLSFELVQKAATAGCPLLVGVGAATSLAVELARAQGITLCGFARGDRLNVYSGAERIDGLDGAVAGPDG